MMLRFAIGALLAVYVSAASLNSRNIERSGKSGDVSLVEFAIRDVVHGKCSYVDRSGRDVKLIYEESQGGKIQARSLNPSVVDPVAAVRECRSAAIEVPKVGDIEGRNDQILGYGDSPLELRARFDKYARTNYENQMYVQQLQPRFLTWLGQFTSGLGTNFAFNQAQTGQNLGLSFGADSTDQSSTLPGINLIGSNTHQNVQTTSFGNPTDIFNQDQTGAWGVLNSIGANGGFLNFLNPFGNLGGTSTFGRRR